MTWSTAMVSFMSPVSTPLPGCGDKYLPYAGDSKRAIDEFHWRQGQYCAFQRYLLAAPIILDLVLFLNSAPGSRSKLKERGQIPSATVVAVEAGEHYEGLARENNE